MGRTSKLFDQGTRMSEIDTDDFWEDWKTKREEVTSQTKERDTRYGYRIVSDTDPLETEKEVVELLKQGWKTAGGLNALNVSGFVHYAQAMVKT